VNTKVKQQTSNKKLENQKEFSYGQAAWFKLNLKKAKFEVGYGF